MPFSYVRIIPTRAIRNGYESVTIEFCVSKILFQDWFPLGRSIYLKATFPGPVFVDSTAKEILMELVACTARILQITLCNAHPYFWRNDICAIAEIL
jgi:hypothetical protein